MRAKPKQANKVAHALRHAPAEIKRRWVEEFSEDASVAMGRLLRGASHVCPECGYDGRRIDKNGHHYACGCEEPNVQAVRLYCELAGAVGAQNTFILQLNQTLGIRDEAELRSLVESGRRLQTLTADATSSLESFRDEALGVLLDCLSVRPEWRGDVLARLGVKALPESTNGVHP